MHADATNAPSRSNLQLVEAFFEALPTGDLPDELFTSDMTAWTPTQGTVDKDSLRGGISFFARLFKGGVTYQIDATTAEADRLAAEVHSHGTLINDEDYAQTHVYIFHFRDGRIASVAEHMNTLVTQEKIVPLIQKMMSRAPS